MAPVSDLIASSPPLPQHELSLYDSAYPSPTRRPSNTPLMAAKRSPSVASDSPSTVSGLPPYLAFIAPKPDYVSQSTASLVTIDFLRTKKELESDNEDDSALDPDKVLVSEPALVLVNNFCDKLLHDILSAAQSTHLPLLRVAVADTLRKTLGKEAVAIANANLDDLLATGDDDDDDDDDEEAAKTRDANWNLEYAWKRVRLRVMIRSEKSDFDIDDDERWVQQTALLPPGRRFSETATAISLQSEIFLAGVLDFISDQLLALSLIPATARMRRISKRTSLLQKGLDLSLLVVEEFDLERGVLNSPLDRLWRSWRKSLRSKSFGVPTSPRHGYSYSDSSSPATYWRSSSQWNDGPYTPTPDSDLKTPTGIPGQFIQTPLDELTSLNHLNAGPSSLAESVSAEEVPLPQGVRDVDEIEVPGLAKDPDAADEQTTVESPRRRSIPFASDDGRTPMPELHRTRSNSDPAPPVKTWVSPVLPSIESASEADPTESVFPKESSDARTEIEAVAAIGAGLGIASVNEEPAKETAGPHPQRQSSLNKRNREAAIGTGHPGGISLPQETINEDASVDRPAKQTSTPDRASLIDPRLQAGSPGSETEGSEIMTPREFMHSRGLTLSREARRDASTLHYVQNPAPNRSTVPKMRLETGGAFDGAAPEPSPVSPLTRAELDAGSTLKQSNANVPLPRKTSLKNAIDVHKTRGSPLTRQTTNGSMDEPTSPSYRKESLRRIAVERRGSIVSLTEDSIPKKGKSVLTSSSITSSEDFDTLLNGGETIKMTLSPSSIREVPSGPNSPALSTLGFAKVNGSSNDLRLFRNRKISIPEEPFAKSPPIGSPGARSRSDSSATDKSGNSGGRPAARIATKKASLTAREATVQTDSVRDFADFIRSTGPDGDAKPNAGLSVGKRGQDAQRAGNAPRSGSIASLSIPTRSGSVASSTPAQRSASVISLGAQRLASLGSMYSSSDSSGPKVSDSAGIKVKRNWEAREPRGSGEAGNPGLIDFIRSGPNAGVDRRPSREVAPFRYSVDEEDMKAIVPISLDHPPSGHRDSIGTMNTMATMGTMNTYASHAPLVPRSGSISYGQMSPVPSLSPEVDKTRNKPKTSSKLSSTMVDSDGVRRYRNKDPYALDISDDDEDEDEEEPGAYGEPITFSKIDAKSVKAAMPSPPPRMSSDFRAEAPPASGLALNGVSYTPVTQSEGFRASSSSSRMQTSQSAPALNGAPRPVVIPRNPNKPRVEARSAVSARSQGNSTRDLADFLRSSGPPEPVKNSARGREYDGGAPSPNIGSGHGGFEKNRDEGKKKFWSRKRYLDMP